MSELTNPVDGNISRVSYVSLLMANRNFSTEFTKSCLICFQTAQPILHPGIHFHEDLF